MSVAFSRWLGAPGPLLDLEWATTLTHLQLAILVAWAVLASRHRLGALLGGVAFASASLGWWILVLDRPYGLFVDPVTTRWVADVAVAGASGDPTEGFVSGTPGAAGFWAELAAHGVPVAALLALPTLTPLIALLLIFLALSTGLPPRTRLIACMLWLAFSTSALESLRGVGFLDGAWPRPAAVGILVASVWVVLAVARHHWALGLLAAGVGAVAAGTTTPIVGACPELSYVGLLLVASLDRLVWWLLAAWSLYRRPSQRPVIGFIGGAAIGLLVCAALGLDPWAALVLERLGLLVAVADPMAGWFRWLDQRWHRRLGARISRTRRLALPAFLLVCLPGSFLVLWRPYELDPVARASMLRPPWSPRQEEALAWIRSGTPADAVVATSPEMAAHVAVEGGRRVLHAPDLVEPADASRRLRLVRRLVDGDAPEALLRRYGVRYLFAAPGDTWQGRLGEYWGAVTTHPTTFDGLPNLRPRYEGRHGFRVYEIVAPASQDAPASALVDD